MLSGILSHLYIHLPSVSLWLFFMYLSNLMFDVLVWIYSVRFNMSSLFS
jgi:hypothetical protein